MLYKEEEASLPVIPVIKRVLVWSIHPCPKWHGFLDILLAHKIFKFYFPIPHMQKANVLLMVLLVAGLSFAQAFDPMTYNKWMSADCQATVLSEYLYDRMAECPTIGKETYNQIVAWQEQMWDNEGSAMENLEGSYLDIYRTCCKGEFCNQPCIRQLRGELMGSLRSVSSLMSSGRGPFLRAGKECVNGGGMSRQDFLGMHRDYWALTSNCIRGPGPK